MTSPLVRVERVDTGVAVVTLDRPPLNALSRALLGAIADAADEVGADPERLPRLVWVPRGPRS